MLLREGDELSAALVGCTKTKTVAAPEALRLRDLPPRVPAELASDWLRRVANAPGRRPARDLYAGPNWKAAVAVAGALRPGGGCPLYVASAGLGLIADGDEAPSYEASFSPGPDQVGRRTIGSGSIVDRHRMWWEELVSRPRCLEIEKRLARSGRVLIVLGREYVRAMEPWLCRLIERRAGKATVLLCRGVREDELVEAVAGVLLPLDGRAEARWPGPLATLNTRVASWVASEAVPRVGWERAALRDLLEAALASVERPEGPSARARLGDDELVEWLGSHHGASRSTTSLLRELRESGYACEQGRFRRLHLDFVGRRPKRIEG